MSQRMLVLAVSIFLLTSCTSTAASPTQPVIDTVSPTSLALATSTAIPDSTPYSPLQTEGPYLMYSIARKDFTILDADATGRKQFQLPDNGFVHDLAPAVSPDGNWLAYFTGSSSEPPYDLALHVLNLKDQTSIPVARLVAPGFPQNLEPVKTSDPVELEDCTSAECRIRLIQSSFNAGIKSIAWSSDSGSLAFAAQIDGPSSDVYIFDVQPQRVRRVVDDLENVCEIEWAPSGKKILFQNCTAGLTYITSYIYAVDTENPNIQSPAPLDGGKFWYAYGWLTDNSYLISGGGEGASPQNFRYLNVDTQSVHVIWPYTAEHIIIDDSTDAVIAATIPSGYIENEPEAGTYLIAMDGQYSKITDDLFVLYKGFKESQMLGWSDDQVYSISLEGDTELIGPSKWNEQQVPSISPDKRWILLTEDQSKVVLYSTSNYEVKNSWKLDEHIFSISWRPDSLGIFVSTDAHIFYLPAPDGEPLAVDDCPPKNFCGYKEFVWLP